MLRRLLFPLSVTLLVVGLDHWTDGALRRDPRLLTAGRVAAVVVLLMSWRLRRGRIAWSVLGLWICAEALVLAAGPTVPGTKLAVFLGAAILLPIHLAVASWLAEWWVVSRAGAVRLAALLAQVALLGLVGSRAGAPFADAIARDLASLRIWFGGWLPPAIPGWYGPGLPFDPLALPLLRLPVFAVAALAIAWALRRRRTPLEAGLLVALATVYPATLRPELAPLAFGAAVTALGVALVENAVRLAFDDGLTGLPARRALEESLGQLGHRFALAMVDIDHFKKLNDRHGHDVGDQVLRKVAARLSRVGAGGRAFRYGGEEFTVVFAGGDAAHAEEAMETVRESIADEPFTVRSPERPKKGAKGQTRRGQGGGEKSLKVTVSVGVAARSEKRPTPEQVLEAADKALYRSKKNGRNRTTVGK